MDLIHAPRKRSVNYDSSPEGISEGSGVGEEGSIQMHLPGG